MAAIAAVKKAGRGFITNLYSSPEQLDYWAGKGSLVIATDRAMLLWRRDRDFAHLYYFAADTAALDSALGGRERPGIEVVDLVGREPETAPLAELFKRHGFAQRTRLVRLVRAASGQERPQDSEFAQDTEAQPILAMLEWSFDRYAEQLPDLAEILAAVRAKQVLVVREKSQIAGLLYFELAGLTARVRYWLVQESHRDRKVGSRLMHGFFAQSAGARRFLLWVLEDNATAIERYRHYGFAPDGLLDRVMMSAGPHEWKARPG